MRIKGNHKGEKVGIVIFDHPESFNHPTYWMNRAYGLFSANPIGQLVYQKYHGLQNPVPVNFMLRKDETVTFKYKILIYEGDKSVKEINSIYQSYCN